MKTLLLLSIAVFLIFAAACGNNGKNTEETTLTESQTTESSITETSPEPTTTEETSPEPATTEETSPETTTAEEISSVILLDYFILPDDSSRPIAVMIDNEGNKSYPQGGIEKAQIVYELIAEYGETRLIPIFYNFSSGNIGPVRSTRHYFIQFVMEYDPILVHIGFSPLGQRMIKNNNLASINGLYSETYPIFFDITKEKNNWQDTYTNFKYLKNFIANSDFRKEPSKSFPFEYSETIPDGDDATHVYLKYSGSYSVSFEYDLESGLYARYRKGAYHIERYTGNVLAARNIIIQFVNTYPIKNDKAGRMTMDCVGTGKGYFITGGKYEEITWEKTSDFSQTSYRYSGSGGKITLNEGQTWIMVISDESKIEIN